MADQALASLQGLYAALSSKNFSEARQYFGGAAADQFDPAFFEQFKRVSVADLRETSRVGSNLNFQGTVTFVYPDGSIQIENRSFSVDTSSSPALITGSEFGGGAEIPLRLRVPLAGQPQHQAQPTREHPHQS